VTSSFTFYFAQTGKDYSTATDRFVLPGRTIRLDFGRLTIEYASDVATSEAARADAERYRNALQAGGLFISGMRMAGEPDDMGWAHSGTIHSARPEERTSISSALRSAREALLELPASEALRQAYGYLQEAQGSVHEASRRAIPPPSSIFVALYKVVETIAHEFGGDRNARLALNADSEIAAVNKICNQGKRDTRHAPRAGETRVPVTWNELTSALGHVHVIVQAYERSLGLP
jgi:hypothetical protein